jgi:adenine-specific DNA-methyltransferase
MEITPQHSELTIKVTKCLTKDEKKKFGIFITPKIIFKKLTESITDYTNVIGLDIKRILEPSCGTCEIVNHCDSIFHNVEIIGIEYFKKIYDDIKSLEFKNNVQIIEANFMTYTTNVNFDLIIGNPPYFVCKKTDIPKCYQNFCSGRPNIFGIFIIHSLSMLNKGGILAFIIPKSFLNSLYYAPIRNFIKKTCKIVNIIDFENDNEFIDTDQSTFGLIIHKLIEPTNQEQECDFSVKLNGNFIFTTSAIILKKLFEGSTTLDKMGLKVRTGNVVWNENKEKLTDNSEDTILIYNSNISKDNVLEVKKFKNVEKGQYIKRDGRIDTTLVVNRGNGNSAYNLNYAIITRGPYLIENHLNEIYSSKKMEKKQLIEIYDRVINSFKNQKTQEFIEQFLGNNGLSKTELETIFPIYYEI